MIRSFSKNQLERYPVYLKKLKEMREQGVSNVTSQMVASQLGYSEEQVKKDFAAVSASSGTPGKGRDLENLIDSLEGFLGYRDSTTAVIIGVGRLGEAILDYPGFRDMGLDIIAAFDSDEEKIGTEISGREIFKEEDIARLMPRLNAHIAIIAVPSGFAQKVADEAIRGGAIGIWNFAPVRLSVPSNVIVEEVNLASSLAVLSHRIKNILKEE